MEPRIRGESTGQAAVAALHEETARLWVVFAIALLFPKQLDDPMDGIVYGSIVGLGMAVEESFHFLQLRGASDLRSFPIEIVPLLGHLVMGGIAGFGVGLGKAGISGWRRGLVISFCAALALHFSWDWVALSASDASTLSGTRSLLACAILGSGILFYGMLVVLGSRLSKAMFEPGSRRGLWGWPFTAPRSRGE
ncbi:MAG: PrsW family glutamic-type intramembrane protease [Vicinamibacteria bacterium]